MTEPRQNPDQPPPESSSSKPASPEPQPPEPQPPEPPPSEPQPSPIGELSTGQLYRVAWAFYMVLALGGIVWVGWRETVIPLALFVDPSTWWADLGLGVAAGLLLIAAWNLGTRRLSLARELEGRLGRLLGELTTSEVIALAIFSGFAEELFFRGAVQGSWGWFWATALFAILHTGPAPAFRLWTLFAAVAGGLFGGLMLWRGNLLAPIVAHFVVNAVNLYRVSRGPLPSSPTAD